MPEYLHPGVYVEEKSSGAKPIEAASTSTACFAGTTTRGRPEFPTFVTSWFQFRNAFGDLDKKHDLPLAVYHFFQNGGSRAYILRVLPSGATTAADPALAAADRAESAAREAGKTASEIADARREAVASAIAAPELTAAAAKAAAALASVLAGTADRKTVSAVAKETTDALTAATKAAEASKKTSEEADRASRAAPADTALADKAKRAAAEADNARKVVEASTPRATAASKADALATANEAAKAAPSDADKAKAATAAAKEFADAMTALRTAKIDPAADAADAARAAAASVLMVLSDRGTRQRVAIKAAGKGAWGNDIKVTAKEVESDVLAAEKAAAANIEVPPIHFDIQVSFAGHVVETWGSLDGREQGDKFYASVINRSSSYIRIIPDASGEFVQGDAAFFAAAPPTSGSGPRPANQVTIILAGGSDGKDQPTADDFETGFGALDRLSDINLLVVPGVNHATCVKAASYVGKRTTMAAGGDLFYIADPPRHDQWCFGPRDERDSAAQIEAITELCNTFPVKNTYTAMYFPWIEVADPYSKVNGATRFAPPSGMIAGLFARTDNTRGVWKAPAGTEASMLGALGVAAKISDQDQDRLNPIGINCIRQFAASGIVCWGARTLGTLSNPEYRYVPVRRTANFLKTSLYKGTQWVVFEPNDEPLWSAIRFNLNAFMSSLFRAGAFQGSKPEEAFFVKCDKDNNRQATIDQGQVHILVGFAPLKPAEFVIIELQQVIKQ